MIIEEAINNESTVLLNSTVVIRYADIRIVISDKVSRQI